jgi:hypothetical protein
MYNVDESCFVVDFYVHFWFIYFSSRYTYTAFDLPGVFIRKVVTSRVLEIGMTLSLPYWERKWTWSRYQHKRAYIFIIINFLNFTLRECIYLTDWMPKNSNTYISPLYCWSVTNKANVNCPLCVYLNVDEFHCSVIICI